GDLESD
nr:Chain Q, IL-18 peptide [Homo sapiens]7JWP_R Chain R, IL-18 peptide [Homo sapiens]7JWP_S Chain S, IL-18 peptide [Homo sapiens]7JWP_T Chain T, IL-18 peptide [Homo sapiens]7JWP_U Chain U, IL-18 peptide [Homo sapiens]7JWP_V Chain V, IL-18 peptide [Homo sapiens]7JWP_W Chain W, IL-18 peptide [Homo sapiens]7JWP_X Chain X, IL-18 peptide [Homo sapiens]